MSDNGLFLQIYKLINQMLWVKSESLCLFVSEPLRLNTSPIAYNACHGECGMRYAACGRAVQKAGSFYLDFLTTPET